MTAPAISPSATTTTMSPPATTTTMSPSATMPRGALLTGEEPAWAPPVRLALARAGFAVARDERAEAGVEATLRHAWSAVGPIGALVHGVPATDPLDPSLRTLRALAEALAAALPAGADGVVVAVLHGQTAVAHAAHFAQIRHLALTCAPRVRVNALRLGAAQAERVAAGDIAQAVAAILGLACMTGQCLTLRARAAS